MNHSEKVSAMFTLMGEVSPTAAYTPVSNYTAANITDDPVPSTTGTLEGVN